jgi:hypothetical protein
MAILLPIGKTKKPPSYKLKLWMTVVIVFTSISSNYAQSLDWVKQVAGISVSPHLSNTLSIATDSQLNTYTVGRFQGTVEFDPFGSAISLTSDGGNDFFVSKQDALGNFLWVKKIGGIGNDVVAAISLTSSNEILITGHFNDTVDFDPGPGIFNLVSDGANNAFVCKLESTGDFMWAVKFSPGISASSLVVDENDDILVTGNFSGTVDFDPDAGINNLTSVGSSDLYVLKLTANGNFVWASHAGGSGTIMGYSITHDNNGNSYVTGMYEATVDFNPNSTGFNLISAGGYDIFVLKLNISGDFVWAKSMGSDYIFGLDVAYSIAVDDSENVYTTGMFIGEADFDPGLGTYYLTTGTANNSYNPFVCKLDANGDFLWATQFVGNGTSMGNSLVLDGLNNVYVKGTFDQQLDFENGTDTFSLISNIETSFIAILNPNGNFYYAYNFGMYGHSISVDDLGGVYSVGYFSGTSNFDIGLGSLYLSSVGNNDIYIHKFSPGNLGFFDPISTLNIRVFPVPTEDYLYLLMDVDVPENTQIKVMDLAGKVVYDKTVLLPSGNTKIGLDISNLNQGLYLVCVSTEKSQFTKKIIKQ